LVQPLPTLYAAYGLPHDVALGVGVFTNFGLVSNWPADWQGRFLLQRVKLNSVTINPTVAWRPSRWVAIGGGVDVTPASVKLNRSIDLVAGEAVADFKGNDVGVGANAGILIKTPASVLSHQISLGVSYRSQYDLSFSDGTLFLNPPPELAGMLGDAKASTVVPIPNQISAGVGVQVMSQMFVQAQVDWTNWSRFQNLTLSVPSNPMMSMTIPQNWHDGVILRTGLEYNLDPTRLRFGFGYDWNPVPADTLSPIVPDSDRFLVSGGALFEVRGLYGEVSAMGVIFRTRDSTLPQFPVRYSTFAILTGLSLSYREH
jgi:long-chain fatty acid transport protein